MGIDRDAVYIITGGAGDIAQHVARIFSNAGARLALVDIQGDALRERADALGALAIEADLTNPDDAERIVEVTQRRFGSLEGLIHTTGGFGMAPAHRSDPDLYDRLFDLNMRTLFLAVRATLPPLLDQGRGFLAALSAAPAWYGSGGGGMSVYAAAKAAVTAFMRAVDAEASERGIRTATVYPMGVVDTPGNRAAMPDDDPSHWIDPAEIGEALLFAASRGARARVSELPIFPAP
jgi:NADP-dependent 3-hydroxy acid dehydrogenase YdfG